MCSRNAPATERDRKPTLEMVRQGVIALEEFSGSYGAEQLVEAVYIAMVDAVAQNSDVSQD
jgi:hypothetical protein